ncbi:hypothetical protein LCGC14_2887730, partial [marine sediment metagenome]
FMGARAKGKNIIGCHSIEEFVSSLASPRKVMLLVKAGAAVDAFIEQILPLLDNGDIIIDGGNSHFPDTIRRTEYVESKGKLYIGTGVSGGEEGALLGPSIMPCGSPAATPLRPHRGCNHRGAGGSPKGCRRGRGEDPARSDGPRKAACREADDGEERLGSRGEGTLGLAQHARLSGLHVEPDALVRVATALVGLHVHLPVELPVLRLVGRKSIFG